MTTRIEPRWLDTRTAAECISVRPDAMMRLVKAGRLPPPVYAMGPRKPRWDRLQLDAQFEGGAASIDVEQAAQAIAERILEGGGRKGKA